MYVSGKPTTMVLTLADLISFMGCHMPRIGRDYCIYYDGRRP